MFRPGGYVQITKDGVVIEEYDTFTCAHCNNKVDVKPKCDPNDLGGVCRICVKMICPTCVAKGSCTPFEAKLEQLEAAYHARRSYQ